MDPRIKSGGDGSRLLSMRAREARRGAPLPFIPAHSASKDARKRAYAGNPEPSARVSGFWVPAFAGTNGCCTKAALILPAWVSSCAAGLLRGSIPSCLRAPAPPAARSGPFPARLAGGVAIWCRRPNACTLARTRGILWGMRPWRALRGGQAGARPVSQPPAPACELPVMKVRISHWRRLR
jgi:hypothetical protein